MERNQSVFKGFDGLYLPFQKLGLKRQELGLLLGLF